MMPSLAEPRPSKRKAPNRVSGKLPATKAGRAQAARSGKAVAKEAGVKIAASRVEAVMAAAEQSGLLKEKSGRIAGRVSPKLVKKAKALTGIETDTDLIAFALASVALEDTFMHAFKAVRGTVDPELDLGF